MALCPLRRRQSCSSSVAVAAVQVISSYLPIARCGAALMSRFGTNGGVSWSWCIVVQVALCSMRVSTTERAE
eukprot:7410-Heterococcus_DN1.PRE.3